MGPMWGPSLKPCLQSSFLILPQRGIAVRGWAQGGPKGPMCVWVWVGGGGSRLSANLPAPGSRRPPAARRPAPAAAHLASVRIPERPLWRPQRPLWRPQRPLWMPQRPRGHRGQICAFPPAAYGQTAGFRKKILDFDFFFIDKSGDGIFWGTNFSRRRSLDGSRVA